MSSAPLGVPFFFCFILRLLYLLKLHHGLSCAVQDRLCVLGGGGGLGQMVRLEQLVRDACGQTMDLFCPSENK